MSGRHATYTGPINLLQGRTALIRDSEGSKMRVLAQFDDTTLEHDGQMLAYGWHLFKKEEFELDPPINWETEGTP
jgi:hypothetical protein